MDLVPALDEGPRTRWVQLVISDAHTRAEGSDRRGVPRGSWQRCRVHFMRNVFAMVPKRNQETVAAAIRAIFAPPDADQLQVIAATVRQQLHEVEAMLRGAHEDLLAFTGFQVLHWKQTWTTNPLERLNKEVKRRNDCRRCLPNPAALPRLVGAVLVGAHDEWQVTAERRYLPNTRWPLLAEKTTEEVAKPALMTAGSQPLTRTVSRISTAQRDASPAERPPRPATSTSLS